MEGRRELGHCIEALFVCRDIISEGDFEKILDRINTINGREPKIIEVPAALYARIAYREGPEGIIAEIE